MGCGSALQATAYRLSVGGGAKGGEYKCGSEARSTMADSECVASKGEDEGDSSDRRRADRASPALIHSHLVVLHIRREAEQEVAVLREVDRLVGLGASEPADRLP